MIYFLPYLILLIFMGICAYLYYELEDEKIRKYILFASCGVFYIFFAFHGYVYTDWTSYVSFFDQIEWGNLFSIQENNYGIYEPGFLLLSIICKTLINSYFFLIIVCTTIDFWLFLRFLKRRDIHNIPLTFFLFIIFGGIILMFNLVRNTLSIFIMMNALEYIEKRKPLQYYSLCLLALSFHVSTLVFFPLYFFIHIRFHKEVFGCCFMLCFLLSLSHLSVTLTAIHLLGLDNLLATKVEAYTDVYSNAGKISTVTTIEHFILAGTVFFYYDKIIDTFKNRTIIINCLMMYFILYYIPRDFSILSERLSTIFLFSYWVLWADIIKIIYWKNNRRLLVGYLGLYALFITFTSFQLPCQEYDNILFGAKNYQERLQIFNRTYKPQE